MTMRVCSANCAYADQAESRNSVSDSLQGFLPSMRTYLRRALGAYQESLRYDRMPGNSVAYSSSSTAAAADTLNVSRLSRYYALNPDALPPAVQSCVRPLAADEETQAFLNSCKSSWIISMLAKLLRCFFSVTDTNAMLRRGQMFVLSREHVRELLASVMYPPDAESGAMHQSSTHIPLKLLDIGAGDGGVTSKFESFMDSITVTEVSKPMGARLRERGYEVHVTPYITQDLFPTPHMYDVVSIFNVLDRCDHPNDLLKAAIRLVKPGTGRLVLAVVLPFSEFVEEGTKRRSVIQPLPMRGARCGDNASFEASLSALVTKVLLPLNLEIERLAKVPYLCQGDHNRPYYVLADAIIVCRALPEVTMRLPRVNDVPFGEQLLQAGGPLTAAPVKSTLRATELPPLMPLSELDKTV